MTQPGPPIQIGETVRLGPVIRLGGSGTPGAVIVTPPDSGGIDPVLVALIYSNKNEIIDHEGRIEVLEAVPRGRSFHYNQNSASSLWQIQHNLGFAPNITAHTMDGQLISYERVDHPNTNISELIFGVPVAGYADAS